MRGLAPPCRSEQPCRGKRQSAAGLSAHRWPPCPSAFLFGTLGAAVAVSLFGHHFVDGAEDIAELQGREHDGGPGQEHIKDMPECASVDRRRRRTRDDFASMACGSSAHADLNAARIILASGPSRLSGNREAPGIDASAQRGCGGGHLNDLWNLRFGDLIIGKANETLQNPSAIPNLIVSMDTKVLNFRIFPFAKNTWRVKSTQALYAPSIPVACS